MKAIVTGMIATFPMGGVAWDYGQYAVGLERMGFDVYYLEDTGWECYDPTEGCYGANCEYGVKFLTESLSGLAGKLANRWHYRSIDGRTFGLSEEEIADVAADATLFLNVSGGTMLRPPYMRSKNKILIDTDPGINHFRNFPRSDLYPGWGGGRGFRAHDHFFTYAEAMGSGLCKLPSLGVDWLTTRPPVLLDCWNAEPPGSVWTTVMTWANFREPIVDGDASYGSKELEFPKIESLPKLVSAPLEIAVGGNEPPTERWGAIGWNVRDSEQISETPQSYRRYVQSSRGELSVAKNVYVATHSGWFSCRSVCYLAAGLPVVVQDTGFSRFLPTGAGLLAFDDLETAAAAVKKVERDPAMHRAAARALAEAEFGSDRVLGELLAQARID